MIVVDDDALPKVRTPTPKQQKEIDKMQAKMASRFDASGRKFDRAYAILNEMNAIPREDWSQRQFRYYVDALVMLGEFETANELTGEYQDILDALNDPQPVCDCRDYESVELVDGKKKQVKPGYKKKRARDIKILAEKMYRQKNRRKNRNKK